MDLYKISTTYNVNQINEKSKERTLHDLQNVHEYVNKVCVTILHQDPLKMAFQPNKSLQKPADSKIQQPFIRNRKAKNSYHRFPTFNIQLLITRHAAKLTHPSLSLLRNILGLGEALGFEVGCIWLLCPRTDPSV